MTGSVISIAPSEPQATKPVTERRDPRLTESKTERELPTNRFLLIDADPSIIESPDKLSIPVPTKEPSTLIYSPNKRAFLTDNEDPMIAVPQTDIAPPKTAGEVALNPETLEIFMRLTTDKLEPASILPRTLRLSPKSASPAIEQADPPKNELNTDREEPIFTVSSTDNEPEIKMSPPTVNELPMND